jgi:hypothetical protein
MIRIFFFFFLLFSKPNQIANSAKQDSASMRNTDVFPERELLRDEACVLARGVEEAGVGRAQQLDQDHASLFLAHGPSYSKKTDTKRIKVNVVGSL